MSNSAFSPTVLTIPGSTSGSGQGELNLITNPVAATDTTGWVGAGRGTSGGPLNPSVSTYFTVLNTASAESSTSGAYDVITLPSGLQNRKLKVEFYYTSPAADTFKVSVYKGTTRVPLSTDSSGTTTLPQSTTSKYVGYFDTDSSGTWTVSITRTAGTGSTALQFTQVVVGPGIQPQGAVVGEWTSYTPTLVNGTNLSITSAKYKRSGSSLEGLVILTATGAGSGGTLTISIPSGLTIDTTIAPSAAVVGAAKFFDSGVTNTPGVSGVSSSTAVYVQLPGAPALTGASFTINDVLTMEFTVPIAEWAGSGTVQLAQNDVEYASNSASITTGNDTTSFAYGPVGSQFYAVTAGGTRRVRFQSPYQNGDRLSLEVSADSGATWKEVSVLGDYTTQYQSQSSASYGLGSVAAVSGSNTDFDVNIGTYRFANGATYGAAGAAWIAGSQYRWRVRKSSAGAAVGVGLVAQSSAGLMPASNSNLDDATATRLGLKQYIGGQTYAAALTVTSTQTLSASRYIFIPYQMQDGTWRLKFNVNGVQSTSSVGWTLTITGITFKTQTAIYQAVTVTNSSGTSMYGVADSGTNTIRGFTNTASNNWSMSGDVELDSKPTWAYS